MANATSEGIVAILRQRLSDGSYADNVLPSTRELTRQFNVARPTVQRALNRLQETGELTRLGVRKLAGCAATRKQAFPVGFFYTCHFGIDQPNGSETIFRAAADSGTRVRPIYFQDWNDPALTEGIDSVEAIILNPHPQLPNWLKVKLQTCGKPVLVLAYDYSEHGFLSLSFFPRRAIDKLLDHLLACGIRDMDLVNLTPPSSVTEERRDRWQAALERSGGQGRFFDFSLTDGHIPFPELVTLFQRRIETGEFDLNRLILGLTMPAAVVFMRAAANLALYAGRDYSLASIDGEHQSELCVPSITSIESADVYPYYRRCLEWMKSGEPWPGNLLWEADDVRLVAGESLKPSFLSPQNHTND